MKKKLKAALVDIEDVNVNHNKIKTELNKIFNPYNLEIKIESPFGDDEFEIIIESKEATNTDIIYAIVNKFNKANRSICSLNINRRIPHAKYAWVIETKGFKPVQFDNGEEFRINNIKEEIIEEKLDLY